MKILTFTLFFLTFSCETSTLNNTVQSKEYLSLKTSNGYSGSNANTNTALRIPRRHVIYYTYLDNRCGLSAQIVGNGATCALARISAWKKYNKMKINLANQYTFIFNSERCIPNIAISSGSTEG